MQSSHEYIFKSPSKIQEMKTDLKRIFSVMSLYLTLSLQHKSIFVILLPKYRFIAQELHGGKQKQ